MYLCCIILYNLHYAKFISWYSRRPLSIHTNTRRKYTFFGICCFYYCYRYYYFSLFCWFILTIEFKRADYGGGSTYLHCRWWKVVYFNLISCIWFRRWRIVAEAQRFWLASGSLEGQNNYIYILFTEYFLVCLWTCSNKDFTLTALKIKVF